MPTKSIFKSWTFWFGLVQLILAGIGYFSGLMSPNEALALAATGATSIGLRFKTDAGVHVVAPE